MMNATRKWLGFCSLCWLIAIGMIQAAPLHALIDWDEYAQDFVLATKQIHIPEYPQAFNPSIIKWNGAYLMSFRIIPYPIISSFNSRIGYVRLDSDFQPIGKAQLLETRAPYSLVPSRSEDARLVVIGDQLYMVYSDNSEVAIFRGGFRVYIAELHDDGEMITTKNIECLSQFEGESRNCREKNWVPFDYNGNMLLAYSLTPHRILRPLMGGTGICETFCSSESEIRWNWGELRGGTAAERVGDEYLSFFHSSIDMESVQSLGKKISHYFMGGYTFGRAPPFAISRMSPEPIIGKGFYGKPFYKPYWKPVRVIFPCGFVLDDDFIWVVYGRHDHESWVVKLDKHKFLDSLAPIN